VENIPDAQLEQEEDFLNLIVESMTLIMLQRLSYYNKLMSSNEKGLFVSTMYRAYEKTSN
jgi:hypothetical protein